MVLIIINYSEVFVDSFEAFLFKNSSASIHQNESFFFNFRLFKIKPFKNKTSFRFRQMQVSLVFKISDYFKMDVILVLGFLKRHTKKKSFKFKTLNINSTQEPCGE